MAGGKSARRKGFRYEREVVNKAKEYGLDAKRAHGSNGEALGLDAKVDLVIEGRSLQAKRMKATTVWLKQEDKVDGVVFRGDNEPDSYVCIKLSDFLDLVASKKASDELEAAYADE